MKPWALRNSRKRLHTPDDMRKMAWFVMLCMLRQDQAVPAGRDGKERTRRSSTRLSRRVSRATIAPSCAVAHEHNKVRSKGARTYTAFGRTSGVGHGERKRTRRLGDDVDLNSPYQLPPSPRPQTRKRTLATLISASWTVQLLTKSIGF